MPLAELFDGIDEKEKHKKNLISGDLSSKVRSFFGLLAV